ncbi:ATP-dependent DNA helicase HFM1/MER3 [Angomonas deanei]|uniref:Type III restriction enzyme, res subunit/DEAD/DEAH box helicase/Helicase conserved C-terminal domain containing protein, putative n=1 Tax=Angomonas deanei TaxID=59799 RepID=A0A7G2C944_9TRYP|nr:ATP-dependent DNA helicase HFM1/MER3 [Angomonas deanei]CAD2216296.1 Type III restriction enzyme, res subunit/DEAD/DEAH box helicase/Helicase conserved C-terminal domain containing protein, putative [Angomonas deanei]|eukprot:EPY37800.1 ATP-dependent DNA helicase HFM1/MER3 [Angomonas deanei]
MSDILQRCLGELSERVSHKKLTKVQENVVPALLTTNHNIVVAAPTGSGKTLLLEMAMFSLFKDQLRKNRTDPAERGLKKAVYICPIKALANEKYSLWKDTFHPLSVVIETGDQLRERSERDSLSSVSTADIVVTTPERWDSITRRWKEKTVMSIVHSVGLLLLDEIHTVHEERGAALEAIVSRMMTIKLAVENGKSKTASLGVVPHAVERVRFVAISGTLPNVEDFAKWLHVPPDMVFSFSNKDRPVPLSIHINGFTNDSNNPFAFDRFLTYKLYNTVKQYSDGKPTMIFCTSRKEVVASALRLVEEIKTAAQREGRENELIPSPEIQQLANKATDKQLKACLLLGFAFHHAALSLQDRLLVEEMFKDQYIAVVCTTTTLALGVNLPAHLVIIKGTSFFKNGKREDIPLSDMAQMCGRAGRPGLDSHGVAVVLTTGQANRVVVFTSHYRMGTSIRRWRVSFTST